MLVELGQRRQRVGGRRAFRVEAHVGGRQQLRPRSPQPSPQPGAPQTAPIHRQRRRPLENQLNETARRRPSNRRDCVWTREMPSVQRAVRQRRAAAAARDWNHAERRAAVRRGLPALCNAGSFRRYAGDRNDGPHDRPRGGGTSAPQPTARPKRARERQPVVGWPRLSAMRLGRASAESRLAARVPPTADCASNFGTNHGSAIQAWTARTDSKVVTHWMPGAESLWPLRAFERLNVADPR
jgi:hypothetical protein